MNNFKEILDLVEGILQKTNDFHSFETEFSQNLRLSGERMVDGATFVFDLTNDYKLLINFEDYEFKHFSLIHKAINEETIIHL